jgi:DNA polymerase I
VQVRAWQERVRAKAQQDKPLHRVQTVLGRHRALPGYSKKATGRERARASRAAINTPVQGSAADVVAAAMIRVHCDPVLKQLGWKMLLQVHDEVCFRPQALET